MFSRLCRHGFLPFLFLLCTFSAVLAAQSPKVAAMPDEELLAAIIRLDLGLEEYQLGRKLNEGQWKKAGKNPVAKRYQGTINYKDGELGIVADTADRTILALYLEKKEAGREDVKNMLATLMMYFGQPTTMAHETTVYWAFNEQGLIPQSVREATKNADDLNILATVKFNSSARFMERGEDASAKEAIYCIVSSPALLERFMDR